MTKESLPATSSPKMATRVNRKLPTRRNTSRYKPAARSYPIPWPRMSNACR